MLKDWDFARFFPSKFQQDSTLPAGGEPQMPSSEDNRNNKQAPSPDRSHRRMESDSKINSSSFFRGFRRENSDFFPLSARHSAIIVDQRNSANPARSSGIFNNRRGSEVGLNRKNSGEPILTDFVKRSDTNSAENKSVTAILQENTNFLRPRREKTESDIVLRYSEARKCLRESLEARRKEVEKQFAKEADNVRRRNSRQVDSIILSASAASANDGANDTLKQQQVIDVTLILDTQSLKKKKKKILIVVTISADI